LGHRESVFDSGWPRFDPALAAEDLVTIAVQVNGKMRGTVSVASGSDQEVVVQAALSDAAIAKFVTATPKKIIFVPGRLLSLVL
jgi:leucyl-tRNA synthetase